MKQMTLTAGVIGVGSMGRNHLRVLSSMSEYELVGCFDINHQSANEQASLYGIQAFDRVEDLLSRTQVAFIVVPSQLHREYAIMAATAGCHVLVEKPIALNAIDAQAIIDACAYNNVRLCIGHVERYNPAVTTLQNVAENEKLIAINLCRMSPYDSRVAHTSVVDDLMIHDVDILNSLIRSPIKSIQAQGASIFSDKLDFAQALISYTDGTLASLTASRITETKIRQINISAQNCFIDVDLIDRKVEVSRKTNFSLDVGYPVQYRQENILEKIVVPIAEPLREEFKHFASCINRNAPIHTSGETAKQALEICNHIQSVSIVGVS